MFRRNPTWCWSTRPPLSLHRRLGSLGSGQLRRLEEEEEEEEEGAGEHTIWAAAHPTVCCHTTGCHNVTPQAADSQRSGSGAPLAPVHTGNSSNQELPGPWLAAGPSPQEPIADGGDAAQHFPGGHLWVDPGTETQGCACVYGQSGPGGLGHRWAGSPYFYYGLRKTTVVGVEVDIVEEVAIEDTETLEVLPEGVFTPELVDPVLLHDGQLHPT